MKEKELIGKEIKNIQKLKTKGCDDCGFLEIEFTDGLFITIVSDYGGYTGNSNDEYPTDIHIKSGKRNGMEVVK